MDIFERASRTKLRFGSTVGELTTEQIWDLPLARQGDRPDLDKLARAAHAELQSIDQASFVVTTPDPRKAELELKLEILKHVIAAKMTAQAAAQKAAETAEYKRKLLDVLALKDAEKLHAMSAEEINAELAKLNA